jgi:predicted phage terminase large subunit-like protein
VEGTNNFFANKILTHNCLIIDDPIKDRQEAESKTARKNVQNWYQAVAYTRVMPGGKIVVINTRWHCFSEDTEILTTDGWIAAKDINKEHLFITQNGIEPIEQMESKHFDGPMYEFTLYGTPKKLKVTGNHKILTADGWKYAEQLTKNDWLIVPNMVGGEMPKFEDSTGKRIVGNQLQLRVKKIDVSQYNGLIYDFETKSHTITAAGVVVHNSNDLSGYLMEEHAHENWAILDLKAIAEPGDILKRKEGEALWPEFRDLEQLEIIKTALGPREWNAQFQQRPTALGGGRVKFEWINHYEQLPKPDEIQRIVASWDTAYKPEQINDPTACTVWIITATGYYLIDVRNKRLEFPDLVKEVQLVHEIHHPSAHLIEGRATGQSLIQELKRSTRIPTVEISTKNINNEIRFDAITTLFESGKVWFPKQAHWLSETEDQICSFPTAPHDDIADSTSQFLNWVNKPRYVPRPPSKLYWK